MTEPELGELHDRYRGLQSQVLDVGFIAIGSYTVCGSAGCHCHGDPPARPGPCFQYTRKLAGKSLTRRLTADQAQRYREWIANRHRLDELIAEMDPDLTPSRGPAPRQGILTRTQPQLNQPR